MTSLKRLQMTPSVALISWLVESVRVTLFTSAGLRDGAWRRLTQADPDSISKRGLGMVVESGRYGEGWLTLQGGPGRVDLVFGAVPAEHLPSPRVEWPAHVGDLDSRLAELKDVFPKLVKEVEGSTTRLALGAALLFPVGSHREGYEALGSCLHAVDLDPESRDFVYRINRPRTIAMPGEPHLLVNRLTTFMVAQVMTLFIQLNESGASAQNALTPPSFACRLELDLSTDAARVGPLPIDGLDRLFEQLAGMAVELAQQGDIR